MKLLFLKVKKFLIGPHGSSIGFKIFKYSGGLPNQVESLNVIYTKIPNWLRIFNSQYEHIADPFIVSFKGNLYCFFEVKSKKCVGKIHVVTIEPSGLISRSICDLDYDAHISYPFIFIDSLEDKIYMIPETSSSKEIAIYESIFFPIKWRKKKILLSGNYVDSYVFKFQNTFYLFTTKKKANSGKYFDYEFCIYYSDSLFGEYFPHPKNPISKSKKYARSGGSILQINDNLFRIAQDCKERYGRDLHFFKINILSKTDYQEELFLEDWVLNTFSNMDGGHHLSTCIWNNNQYIAVDFNYKDSYFQRFINLIFK